MGAEAFKQLSPRERDVLLALMRGETAKQIANRHDVSLATVRSQIQSVLSKLGVRSQLEAVVLAHRTGWQPLIDDIRLIEAVRFIEDVHRTLD